MYRAKTPKLQLYLLNLFTLRSETISEVYPRPRPHVIEQSSKERQLRRGEER